VTADLAARLLRRRARHVAFWRVVNPINRALVPVAPWWVLLETTGRRSGRLVRTPLARGPSEADRTWLISVHGTHADWVRNLQAKPSVRLRIRGRWRPGRASVRPYDPALAARFNRYARSGPRLVGIEPVLVEVELTHSRMTINPAGRG
jgi:deazaflavin-dependent oxidoreductase (nitroreductase family)